VSVAGVTVAAAELASSVRVDAPAEREAAARDGLIQQRADRERAELDQMAFAGLTATGGKTGDAAKRRICIWRIRCPIVRGKDVEESL
jgi:hypothetical protein